MKSSKKLRQRANNLWMKAPKFKPWMVEFPSGTVVVGLANKLRSSKVLELVYITKKMEVYEELYLINSNETLQFARRQGEDNERAAEYRSKIDAATFKKELVREAAENMMKIANHSGAKAARGFFEVIDIYDLHFNPISGVERSLKWTEGSIEFLEIEE